MTPLPLATTPRVEEDSPAGHAKTTATRIRSYTPDDHTAVMELFTAGMMLYANKPGTSAALHQVWLEYIEYSTHGDLASIQATYFTPGGHFWVATIQDEHGREVIVGFVGLERQPNNEGELRRMSVKAEFRRFGIAKLLVENLQQWAKTQGLAKIWLSAAGTAVQAQHFYLAIGFTYAKTETYRAEPLFELVFFEKAILYKVANASLGVSNHDYRRRSGGFLATGLAIPSVDFVIRSYEPRDHAAVCALFAEGMLFYAPSEEEDPGIHHGLHDYVNKCFTEDLGNIEATYLHAGGHFWVVAATSASGNDDEKERKEEIAAIVALQDKGNGLGELRRHSVSSKFRRHGLGVTLVTHVEQWAAKQGFTAIQLTTDCVMTPALKLYDRLGYTRTHMETIREEPHYFLVWFHKLLA